MTVLSNFAGLLNFERFITNQKIFQVSFYEQIILLVLIVVHVVDAISENIVHLPSRLLNLTNNNDTNYSQ